MVSGGAGQRVAAMPGIEANTTSARPSATNRRARVCTGANCDPPVGDSGDSNGKLEIPLADDSLWFGGPRKVKPVPKVEAPIRRGKIKGNPSGRGSDRLNADWYQVKAGIAQNPFFRGNIARGDKAKRPETGARNLGVR